MIKRDALVRFADKVKAASILAKPRYETRPTERAGQFSVFDSVVQAWVVGVGPFSSRQAADAATDRHNSAYERTLLP